MAKPGKAKTRMTDIIEAVARAIDPHAFKQQAKYDKYNGDNPAVERDAAVWDEAVSDARTHAKAMLAVATPLITEKVLRDMLWEANNNGEWYSMQLFIKHLARTRYGIDLTKDTDNG